MIYPDWKIGGTVDGAVARGVGDNDGQRVEVNGDELLVAAVGSIGLDNVDATATVPLGVLFEVLRASGYTVEEDK